MKAFYNDIEPYSTELLELRVADGWLPDGEISSEDIRKVATQDLSKYGQCHLFAGIGGFPLGARLAGLPDVYRLFTAGFPCQPFSNAGRKAGASDSRYLWPETLAALKSHRPDVAVLENVSGLTSMAFPSLRSLMDIKTSLAGFRDYIYRKKELGILNHITDGLEEAGYSVQPLIIPACATDAKHRRDRIWIVCIAKSLADTDSRDDSGTPRRHGEKTEKERLQKRNQNRQSGQSGDVRAARRDLANTGQRRRGEPNQGQNQQSRRTQAFSTSEDVADAASAGLPRGTQSRIHTKTKGKGARSIKFERSDCTHGHVPNADGINGQGVKPGKPHAEIGPVKGKRSFGSQSGVDGRLQWAVEPGMGRVVAGLSGRVDRIKGLGNAIVPAVVAEILTHIMTALEIEPEWHI